MEINVVDLFQEVNDVTGMLRNLDERNQIHEKLLYNNKQRLDVTDDRLDLMQKEIDNLDQRLEKLFELSKQIVALLSNKTSD